MFMHRGASPLGPQEVRSDNEEEFLRKEADSADTPALPNRVAAGSFGTLRQ